MRVTAPDGRRLRVGRRWLPWRRRVREVDSFGVDAMGDDPVTAVIGLVLLIPFVAALVVFLGELLLLLLLLPVLALLRVVLGRPWTVQVVELTKERPVLWSEPVRGWHGSGARLRELATSYERGLPPTDPAPGLRRDVPRDFPR